MFKFYVYKISSVIVINLQITPIIIMERNILTSIDKLLVSNTIFNVSL